MENTEKNIKPRKAVIAFLLSLLVPGLGQLYNGQMKKTLLFSFGLLFYVVSIYLLGIVAHFWLFFASIIVLVVLLLFNLIDATLTARRNKEHELKWYNKWYVYLLFVVVWHFSVPIIAQNAIEKSRYRLFSVKTHAGYPNLFVNDAVLVDTRAYRHQEPDYGDLVVISMTIGGYSVFRIVGMPNDTLIIEPQSVKYRNSIPAQIYRKNKTTMFVAHYLGYERKREMEIFTETLPNGVTYKFVRREFNAPWLPELYRKIIVPDNSYFVLGDNRLYSGFTGFSIEREQIRGRVLAIYFNRRDLTRINRRL